jgi:Flp pilus assembly protein TadG
MRRTTWCRPVRARDDGGLAAIEAAIALPIALLLLLMVVQAGVYFHTRSAAASAAHHGLDATRVETGSVGRGHAVVEDFLGRHAGALQSHDVDVRRGDDTATVTVSGQVVSVLFGAPLFPLHVTVRGPVEEVVP